MKFIPKMPNIPKEGDIQTVFAWWPVKVHDERRHKARYTVWLERVERRYVCFYNRAGNITSGKWDYYAQDDIRIFDFPVITKFSYEYYPNSTYREWTHWGEQPDV